MVVRGVYNNEEQTMIESFKAKAEAMAGWRRNLLIPVATEASIKSFANAADYWNPLWHDEDYARNTRWGGIIAPPMYQDAIAQITWFPEAPREAGFLAVQWLGEDWTIFKPIHVNDSFRVWCRRPKLTDSTSSDGDRYRTFQMLAHDVDVLNQKDEIVNKFKLYLDVVILPERPEIPPPLPEYVYTKEELAYIDRIFKEEKIRGSEVRWWEDVNIGDELRPVIMGPTTLWDQIVYTAGRQEIELVPMMEMRRRGVFLTLDPATGVTHHGIEWHHSDNVARLRGEPHSVCYGVVSRQLLTRCVTNWMGDDGFIKTFHWRHLGPLKIGDTVIAKGKVMNKRIEDGEHLVDISLWTENLRGCISVPALVTVSLLSKESV